MMGTCVFNAELFDCQLPIGLFTLFDGRTCNHLGVVSEVVSTYLKKEQ
jgi:hypothetical protein